MASTVDIILNAKNNASRELNKVTGDLQKMDKSASRLMSMGGIAGAIGVTSIAVIAKTGFELAKLAGQFDSLYASFEQLAASSGESADAMLAGMQRASKGMISDMSLVQSANRAMLLGVADSTAEMQKLLEVAIVRGQAMGLSAEQAFNDLVTGIGRMSPLILDNLGIVTGGEKVFNDYAASIGKAADALTDAEKKQALLNKVVSESADMIATSAESATAGFERLSAAIEGAKVKLGQAFSAEINQSASNLASTITTMIDKFVEFDRVLKADYAISGAAWDLKEVEDRIADLQNLQAQLRRDVNMGADAADYAGSRTALAGVNAELELMRQKQWELFESAGQINAQWDTNLQSWGAMSDISNPVLQDMQAIAQTDMATPIEDAAIAAKALEESIKATAEWIATNPAQSFTDQFGEAATKSQYEYFGGGDAMAASYEDGLAALQRQTEARREQNKLEGQSIENQQRIQASIESTIESLSQAAAARVYDITGNTDNAVAAYEEMKASLSGWVQAQNDANRDIELTSALLSTEAQRVEATGSSFLHMAEDIDVATASLADMNAQLDASIAKLYGFSGATMSEQYYFGEGGAPADPFEYKLDAYRGTLDAQKKQNQLEGEANAERQREEERQIQAIERKRNAQVRAANDADAAYGRLESTLSGIISSAIGPVAGVDANDLLPREDAVNENARRLADIAVNGFKGQDWLAEFQNQVPDIYQALVDSGDPKMAAAGMLKDFQDGLLNGTGALIDREKAKALVRRALLGEQNTQALINEIAQELAAETGTSFSAVQQQAQSLLGGTSGASGATGDAFVSGIMSSVQNSNIGADMAGVLYSQITASVSLIESSGNEAGRALVRGVTAKFVDIPAAFIQAVASLVTPAVQASINSNGGRTGAANI